MIMTGYNGYTYYYIGYKTSYELTFLVLLTAPTVRK